jgi:hypothetical protein
LRFREGFSNSEIKGVRDPKYVHSHVKPCFILGQDRDSFIGRVFIVNHLKVYGLPVDYVRVGWRDRRRRGGAGAGARSHLLLLSFVSE